MKKTNKKNIIEIFTIIFMSMIISITPLASNLNKDVINTVFASAEDELNLDNLSVDSGEEINSEIKDKSNKLDKKVYYKGNIEDDFADDKVIIVFNEEETHKFKTYTPEDFKEIDCISVKDLTRHSVEHVKQEIQNRDVGENSKKVKKNKYS